MNACCEALLLKWRALKSVVEFSCDAATALAAFGAAGAACLASADCAKAESAAVWLALEVALFPVEALFDVL